MFNLNHSGDFPRPRRIKFVFNKETQNFGDLSKMFLKVIQFICKAMR